MSWAGREILKEEGCCFSCWLPFGLALKGPRIRAMVGSFSRQKLLMRTLFHHAAPVKNDDLVRVLDGTQTMGNHNGGTIFLVNKVTSEQVLR
jgi:hypothetical protein